MYAGNGSLDFGNHVLDLKVNDEKGIEIYGFIAQDNASSFSLGTEKNHDVKLSISSEGLKELYGAYLSKGPQMNVKANNFVLDLTTNNGVAIGLHAQNNTAVKDVATLAALPTTIDIDANSISMTLKQKDGRIYNNIAIVAISNGIVRLKGNTTIVSEDLIHTRGYATVEINKDGGFTSKLQGDIVFENSASNASGTGIDANVNICLDGEESFYTGRIIGMQAIAPDAQGDPSAIVTGMKMQVKNGATAHLVKTSFLNNLFVDDKGKVIFDGSKLLIGQQVGNRVGSISSRDEMAKTMKIEATSDGTGTFELKNDSVLTFAGTDSQTAEIEVLTANGSKIYAGEGAKNPVIKIVGTNADYPSSLTNTNVTGVNIVVNGEATLNIDGGTFTNTGFSGKNGKKRLSKRLSA